MGGRTDCWCERESVHVCTESASTARATPYARVGPLTHLIPIVSVFRHLVRRRGANRRAGRTSRRRCGVCLRSARRCAYFRPGEIHPPRVLPAGVRRPHQAGDEQSLRRPADEHLGKGSDISDIISWAECPPLLQWSKIATSCNCNVQLQGQGPGGCLFQQPCTICSYHEPNTAYQLHYVLLQ